VTAELFAPGPSNLRSVVTANSVRIDWDQAPGAGAWQVEVGSGPGLSNLATFRTTSQALTANGVPNGVYYVRVRSAPADFSDLSAPSNEIVVTVGMTCTGPPNAPFGLSSQVSGFNVTLSWVAPGGTPPSSYIVEVGSTSGASNLLVSDTNRSATSLQAVAAAGTYYARIRARNACGQSAASNQIVVTVGAVPSPPPPPAQNLPPTFALVTLRVTGYRTVTLTADVRDAGGQVARVVVDWGDGRRETITTGFANISRTHAYDNAQGYQVVLAATDNLGATSQDNRSVTITVPPVRCVGIAIGELCGQVTSDFSRIRIWAEVAGIETFSFTVVESTPTLTFSPGVFTRVTASFNFANGRLRLQGEFCVIPFVVCSGLFDETIQF
jgi:hypothetical protein